MTARLVRRLLVVGGFLLCGWLLGGVNSAYAADDGPLPVPSVAGTAATDVVRDAVDKAARDTVDTVTAPVKDRPPVAAKPPRTEPDKVAALVKPAAERTAADTARTVTDQVERTTSRATTPKKTPTIPQTPKAPAVADSVRSGITAGVTDTVTAGVGDEVVGGVTDGLAGGVTSTVAKTVDTATTTLTRPLDALPVTVSTLTAPVGSVTGPLGTLTGPLTAPLTTLTGPLGSVGVPVEGLLGQLDGTANLLPRVREVISPVTAKSALLVGPAGLPAANVGETVLRPEPTAGSSYPLGAPLGTTPLAGGTASATVCRVVYAPLLCAEPLSLSAPAYPLSAVERTTATGDPYRMPWPSSAPVGIATFQGMRSSPETGDRTPGAPPRPRSADSSHVLPTSSHGDGVGDAARPWEVRVRDMFVAVWRDPPPAVRSAANEPGFSPD